jgi:diguanylate cyclase (GGDEF)-like protein
MKFQYKLYATLIVSFILLILSLILNYKTLQQNTHVLNYLNKDQITLTYFTNKLNYDLKKNQSVVLQHLLLDKDLSDSMIQKSFQNIDASLLSLKKFVHAHNLPATFIKLLNTIEKRVVSYKIIENSILTAMEDKDQEDLQDAVIGFNNVIQKFSRDTENLTNLSNALLYDKIIAIEHNNTKSSLTLLFSFFAAFLLIIFAISKFNQLHADLKIQLKRAQEAEADLKKIQKKLLKYNEDLEAEIEKQTQELYKKIYTHPISHLPNRNKLLEDASSYNFTRMALLNIDRFQSFNDVYGEEIGNIALKMTADFLKDEIEDLSVKLYHIGGDEFVIVCVDHKNHDNHIFIGAINKILKHFRKHVFIYKDQSFQFMMSAGLTFTGKNKMLAYADMALKDAKRKNIQLSLFHEDKSLEKRHKDDMECLIKLKSALERDAIVSYFQPIVPLQNNNTKTKYESLVRLVDEKGKVISPFNFINVARANRIYYKITQRVLKNTLAVIKHYQIPCSINFSMSDIQNEKTMRDFFEILDDFAYNEFLTIELLETEDFQDYQSVHDFCLKVRTYGIKIALDDFGSGYANFSHIVNLPIDFIKIDASLISNIDKSRNSRLMVESIVALAKKLHVETIAEFVSSKKIMDVVKELGVDYAQGFHLGKPLRIEKYIKD